MVLSENRNYQIALGSYQNWNSRTQGDINQYNHLFKISTNKARCNIILQRQSSDKSPLCVIFF